MVLGSRSSVLLLGACFSILGSWTLPLGPWLLFLGQCHQEVAERPALANARVASDDNTTLWSAIQPLADHFIDIFVARANKQLRARLSQPLDAIWKHSDSDTVNGLQFDFTSKKSLPKSGDSLTT